MQSKQYICVGCTPMATWGIEAIWETEARWAPPIEDPCKDRLLRIISDMWSRAVDSTAEVTVGAHDDVGGGHEGFERQ